MSIGIVAPVRNLLMMMLILLKVVLRIERGLTGSDVRNDRRLRWLGHEVHRGRANVGGSSSHPLRCGLWMRYDVHCVMPMARMESRVMVKQLRFLRGSPGTCLCRRRRRGENRFGRQRQHMKRVHRWRLLGPSVALPSGRGSEG